MFVHLIAATGLSGQIGLNGEIPWHNDPAFDAITRKDVAQFTRMTAGGVLVMGSITAKMLPANFREGDRAVLAWSRASFSSPRELLAYAQAVHRGRDVWICGGQKVYELFMPFVDWFHVSVLPYDGPADRFLPPILPSWSRNRSQHADERIQS